MRLELQIQPTCAVAATHQTSPFAMGLTRKNGVGRVSRVYNDTRTLRLKGL